MAEEEKKKKKQSIGAEHQEGHLIMPRGLSISEQNRFRAQADSVHTSEKMNRFLAEQEKNRKTKKKRRAKSDEVMADLRSFAETGTGKTFNRTATEEAVAKRVGK